MKPESPSVDYIHTICALYNDYYDDREEDAKPGGEDWTPGITADHKSLATFQKELEDRGIKLSRSKIQKILVTGGRWSAQRSREVQKLYQRYLVVMLPKQAVKRVADELEISTISVNINLPYEKTVYDLEEKSGNAKRIERWRRK